MRTKLCILFLFAFACSDTSEPIANDLLPTEESSGEDEVATSTTEKKDETSEASAELFTVESTGTTTETMFVDTFTTGATTLEASLEENIATTVEVLETRTFLETTNENTTDEDNDGISESESSGGGGGGGGNNSKSTKTTNQDKPRSIVAISDGKVLGEVMYVNAHTVSVWDRERNFIFSINDSTGYLIGLHQWYANSNDCTSEVKYLPVHGATFEETCSLHANPKRRYVYASGGNADTSGFTQGQVALVPSMDTEYLDGEGKGLASGNGSGIALTGVSKICVSLLVADETFPTAYKLPIEFKEL